MKKIIAIFIVLAAWLVPAMGQTVPAEYKAEVEKILEATNTKPTLVQTLRDTWKSLGIPNSDNLATAVVDDLWPDLVNDYTEEYYRHLDLTDMQNISKFYSTPTGKKLGAALPAINANVMKTVQTKYMTRIQRLLMNNM
jgi:hypothetical protein